MFQMKYFNNLLIVQGYLLRLVELEKLRLATRKEEEKFIADAGVDPFVVIR